MMVQRFAARCRQALPGLSKRIDRLNLVTKPYPPIPNHIKKMLQSDYREDMQRLIANFDLDAKSWS